MMPTPKSLWRTVNFLRFMKSAQRVTRAKSTKFIPAGENNKQGRETYLPKFYLDY